MKRKLIRYNEESGEYENCSVTRGFPLGGMGSGGFNIGSDGRFTEFRINNNWMAPVKGVKGTFFAIYADNGHGKYSRILRRTTHGKEYTNIEPVVETRFKGELPEFRLSFEDVLPVNVRLKGFTPHIPHSIKDSTIPGVLLTLEISNPDPAAVSVSVLFSWENILGLGGTGFSGFKMIGKIPVGFKKRLKYTDVNGNYQEILPRSNYPTVAYRTRQSPNPLSHRFSTIGEYRLSVEPPDGFEVSSCSGWDAREESPTMLSEFTASGRIPSQTIPKTGSKKCRPAAAIAVSGEISPGKTVDIVFSIVWWMPDHVTEKKAVIKAKSGRHDGKRVGHVFENFFNTPDEVTDYLFKEKARLYSESMALSRLVDQSTLPVWLKQALKNSTVSAFCNSVIPKDGTMYTIEGTDWLWPYGGLTGTNDQRLSSHPYTATFFTDLDMREVDAFRRLMDKKGSVPHGNGNCDFGLGDADVPYGWPVEIKFIMPAQNWTDLTMSEIIQAGKIYRITGDKTWIDTFWPDMKRMADYLDTISVNGVPEGGTTYDIWNFPGTFIYSATVYLAALAVMKDLAIDLEESCLETFQARYDACQKRVKEVLWQEEEGFFKSTSQKETLFTASMAGDWVSRYAGLGPVVDETKARRHMALQYELLVNNPLQKATEKHPLPWAEAKKDGTKVTVKSLANLSSGELVYIWQVLSYQAMEHIYLGQTEMGLETIKMIYTRIYEKGYVWSAGLRGNNDSIYMTNTVLWAVLNAISGAALDVPRGVLTLSPRKLPGQKEMKVPVCFPGFWAIMTCDFEKKSLRFEVSRHFGEPVSIRAIRLRDRHIQLDVPLNCIEGEVWEEKRCIHLE